MTRVELHSARSTDDYTLLHREMEKDGFSRTITSTEPATYHLPPAEYYYSGNVTRAQVLAKAESAAQRTKHSYGVIVCEGPMTWNGLKRVN